MLSFLSAATRGSASSTPMSVPAGRSAEDHWRSFDAAFGRGAAGGSGVLLYVVETVATSRKRANSEGGCSEGSSGDRSGDSCDSGGGDEYRSTSLARLLRGDDHHDGGDGADDDDSSRDDGRRRLVHRSRRRHPVAFSVLAVEPCVPRVRADLFDRRTTESAASVRGRKKGWSDRHLHRFFLGPRWTSSEDAAATEEEEEVVVRSSGVHLVFFPTAEEEAGEEEVAAEARSMAKEEGLWVGE